MTLPILTRTLLEQAAFDNGFDQTLPGQDDDWIGFKSSQIPLQIWLGAIPQIPPTFLVAYSIPAIARALELEYKDSIQKQSLQKMPKGARAIYGTQDLNTIHGLIRRAFQLAQQRPNEYLDAFQAKTNHLPKNTETERLSIQRVGQDLFRAALLEHWQGRCALTGLDIPELLRASHIKPWAECESDAERLDVWNGFLFAPHVDALFDRGYISVDDDGQILWSAKVSREARERMGLQKCCGIEGITSGHRRYLPWHRARIFR